MDENNFRLNEIIRRIAEDDKQAQVDLLYEYGRYIKTAALATSNKISSDDVVISILTKIVMNAEKIAKKEVTTAWLYKISVNETKNTERNEAKFYKKHCRISDETAADLYIKEEERLLAKLNFERIISILDKDEKTIIILKCVYDMTFTQIANELNKPVSTISTQYYSSNSKRAEQACIYDIDAILQRTRENQKTFFRSLSGLLTAYTLKKSPYRSIIGMLNSAFPFGESGAYAPIEDKKAIIKHTTYLTMIRKLLKRSSSVNGFRRCQLPRKGSLIFHKNRPIGRLSAY